MIACDGATPPTAPHAVPAASGGEAAHDGHGAHAGQGHGAHGGHGHAAHAGPAAPAGHHVDHADHRFDDAARWAAVFDDPTRDEWQRPDDVVALLGIGPGQTVVDLGAGTGYFERRLSAKVGSAGRVLALDVEPDMVAHLEQRAQREAWRGVEPRLVATDDPGLGVAQVDRILVVNTWHHLPERAAYAGKLAAALRAGGRLAVVDFTLDAPMGPPAAARLSAEQVVAELTAVGLTATIATESLPHQYVVVGVRSSP